MTDDLNCVEASLDLIISQRDGLLAACESFIGAFHSGEFREPEQVIPYIRAMNTAIAAALQPLKAQDTTP